MKIKEEYMILREGVTKIYFKILTPRDIAKDFEGGEQKKISTLIMIVFSTKKLHKKKEGQIST